MSPEAESQRWNALFESKKACPTTATVAWLMSEPDRQFIQLLATHCDRKQLIALVGATRQVLRQVLSRKFAPLRDGLADGAWHRGVQRALDELVELRPDLGDEVPAYDDGSPSGGVVVSELEKAMSRLPEQRRVCG